MARLAYIRRSGGRGRCVDRQPTMTSATPEKTVPVKTNTANATATSTITASATRASTRTMSLPYTMFLGVRAAIFYIGYSLLTVWFSVTGVLFCWFLSYRIRYVYLTWWN